MSDAPDLVPHGARFNFGRELRKERRRLEERVAAYAAEHPELGYRELCKEFSLSLGAILKIIRRRRKPKASRDSFIVRYEHEGQKLVAVVTVRGRASTEEKRLGISERYNTKDILIGDDPSIRWRTDYTVQELRSGCNSNQLVFEVPSQAGEKKFTRITVAAEGARNLSLASVRSLVAALYKTDNVSTGESDAKPDRQVQFTIRELEDFVKRASITEKALGAVP